MGSLGVAECHFILEETGGWGAEFLLLHQLLSHAQFSSQCPSTQPPTPTPSSCKLLLNPQNPTRALPLSLGAFPDQSFCSSGLKPDESPEILLPLLSCILVREQILFTLFPKSVPSGVLSGTSGEATWG